MRMMLGRAREGLTGRRNPDDRRALTMNRDYPFLDLILSMLVFFVWAAWFVMLFWIIVNILRRKDIGGGSKVIWLIFVVALPYLGVFVYILSQGGHLDVGSSTTSASPTEEIA